MALTASTSAANQTIALAAGSFTGHILVSHTGCTVEGAGPTSTIVVLDGTYAEGVRPGASVATFTLKNLTLDCAGLAGVSTAIEIGGGIAQITCENVRVIDHHRAAKAVDSRGVFRGTNIEIIGNGGGIDHRTGATECTLRGVLIEGGRFGFQNTAPNGIDIDDFSWTGDYWQSPMYESVTHEAYGSTYVDVTSHVSADRTLYDVLRHLSPVTTFQPANTLRSRLVRVHDRIEIAGIAWSRVLTDNGDGTWELDAWRVWGKWRKYSGTPSGIATVYRPTLGMYFEANVNRLQIQTDGGTPTSPRWRYPNGDSAPTPSVASGSRLDIIRVGGNNNDTDSGGIHITETAVNARVTNVYVRGGRSDCITLRGTGTVSDQTMSELGYDMGHTIDGTNGRVTVTRAHAATTGRSGFHVTGGPCDLYACSAVDNGTINDGSGDYGCAMQAGTEDSHLEMVGSGNLDGLVAGVLSAATHVATVETGAPPYPFVMTSPFWRAP